MLSPVRFVGVSVLLLLPCCNGSIAARPDARNLIVDHPTRAADDGDGAVVAFVDSGADDGLDVAVGRDGHVECVPVTEQCNGVDDDCDGIVDEDDTSCRRPNREGFCVAGRCVPGRCDPNWGDCDGDTSNGCETRVDVSRGHCGGCGHACIGFDSCAGGSCGPIQALSLGARHSCALHASGRVLCWGANGHGQVGDGTQQDRESPTLVLGLDDAIAIGAGGYNSCAVRRERGVVVCWGVRTVPPRGQTPSAAVENIALTPIEVPGSAGSTRVELGEREGCSLTGPHSIPRCYGLVMRSGESELHDYLTHTWIDDTPESVAPGDPPFGTESMLLWGRFRAFIRTRNHPSISEWSGTLLRWWAIDQRHPGEFACTAARCAGIANNPSVHLLDPILVGTENHAFGVGAPWLRLPQGGFGHRLNWIDFVRSCLGCPGNESRVMEFVSRDVCENMSAPGCEMNDIRAVSAGFDRVCFQRIEGRWYCGHEDRRSFARVPWMDAQVGALHMGKQSHFACFLTPLGAVRCWGEDNSHGQIGDGTRSPRERAVTILGG